MKIQKSVLTHFVEYWDFEDAVNDEFKVGRYEYLSSEKVSNDSCTVIHVRMPGEELMLDLDVEIDLFIAADGEKMYMQHYLMQELCNRGRIAPGLYVINVSY